MKETLEYEAHYWPQITKNRQRLVYKLLFFALGFFVLFNNQSAYGQTIATSTLRGQVTDQTGGVVANAQITVTNPSLGFTRETATDNGGYYAIAQLPLTGKYQITISSPGFATKVIEDLELRADEAATINIGLSLPGNNEIVQISGTTSGVRADSPQLSTRLDLQKIDNTPVFGRKVTNLAQLDSAVRPARGTGDLFLNNFLFISNGSGRRQTTFTVDGSTGDDSWGRQTIFTNLPLSSIQEFTILTNSFSAEYGRTAGGAVSIVTKSGTNDLHSDLLLLFRPTDIQARTTLAPTNTDDRLVQFSGVVSGPIVKDRTHFLVGVEYNSQNRDAVITSPLAAGLFTGEFRQTLFLARIDHQLNNKNILTGKLNFDRFSDTNPADAVGGLNLPSAARIFRRKTYNLQLAETANLGNAFVNEARAQFQLASPITQFEPVTPATQFVRPGLATEGESRAATLLNHQFQFADTLSLVKGRHNLRFGGELIYSSSGGDGQEFGGGFVLGQFTLNPGVRTPIAQLTLKDVQRFTQSFGKASYNVKEYISSFFVQDNFSLNRNLTLNLGLRYENQSFTDDDNNIAPRIGFAYSPFKKGQTVLRGSYGIYYSEIRANLAANYNINGPAGIFTFSAAPGQLGFPTTLGPIGGFPVGAVLPPRDINIRPGQRQFLSNFFNIAKLPGYSDQLLNPYTQMATFGIEQELPGKLFLRVDYVHQNTIDIDRPVDLNAPAPFVRTAPGQVRAASVADLTRPIVPVANGFRRIIATINEGASYYDGLQVNLNKRLTHNFSVLFSYTYSHTINTVEPDVPQQDPNDANLLGAPERATSLLDQRHRAVISGFLDLPLRFTVGGLITLASGRPYNITTGLDNNGDGSNADRPVINGSVIARNSGRGTSVYDVQMFVEKHFKLTERAELSFRAEAFNLFNHSNIVGRNGVFGNDAKGTPALTLGMPLGGINNVDPGREFQFLVHFRF